MSNKKYSKRKTQKKSVAQMKANTGKGDRVGRFDESKDKKDVQLQFSWKWMLVILAVAVGAWLFTVYVL